MGLAASQARLLTLTAYQNSIEGQLSDIADQKIGLARASAQASEKYSDALNSKKLTWNTGNKNYDLTYDLLMTPNSAIDKQYILASSTGSVLMDDTYLNMLGYEGTSETGSMADLGYNSPYEFAARLMGDTTATAISDAIAAANASQETQETSNTTSTLFTTSYSDADVFRAMSNSGEVLANQWNASTGTTETKILYSGDQNQVICFYADGASNSSFSESQKDLVATNLAMAVNNIVGVAADAVKGVLAETSPSYSSQIAAAAAKAKSDTIAFYRDNFNTNGVKATAGNDHRPNNDKTINDAKSSNQVMNDTYGADEAYLNVGQVVKTFLNFFDGYCAAYATNNDDNKTALNAYTALNKYGDSQTTRNPQGGSIAYATKNGYTIETQQEEIKETQDAKNAANNVDVATAKFYINLYNAICVNGWKKTNADNADYLETQVLNGNIQICTVDGYGNLSAMSTSSANCPLETEDDDDTIHKAEAEYKTTKDELDYKESLLDVQMSRLDQKRAAVETTIESTQKIVDKNVEVFKMFEA